MGQIRQIKTHKGGAFLYEEDQKKRAEMAYIMAGEKKMIIEHTEVDEELKGQGIGKTLLTELISYVRTNQIEVIPLCPFAAAMFKKIPEWQDVLSGVRFKKRDL